MTPQEALNTVYGWYVMDKHEPADHAYYEPETRRRCAVGCLLSDETAEQTGSFLNLNVHGLLVTNSAAARELAGLPERFLFQLQLANDKALEEAFHPFLGGFLGGYLPGELGNALASIKHQRWPEIVALFHRLIEEGLRALAYRFELQWPGVVGAEEQEREAVGA